MRRLPLLALALLVACGPAPRERFTLEQQLAATIAGIPDARAWGDSDPAGLSALGFAPAEVAARREGRLDYLALSSGGPAGAFGAGVLVGWGEAGTRPEFDVVTGVSAGALLAPFAFVGAQGDAALRELWAEGAARELGRGLNPVGLLNGQGLVDRGPLEDLLATHVDDGLVAAIARGHREGRRLLVVTTNLDAQRPVIWNLGAIAASGRPGAANLLREVLLASSSVPVAFPPVLIGAEAGGAPLREMHVDGGTSAQIFAFPDAALVNPGWFAVPPGRDARLWLLVNYVIEPEFGVTPAGSVGVGQRAYGTLIKSDLRSELFAIIDAAEETGFEARLASIRRTVPWDPRDPFSPEFMRTVFELGRREAVAFGAGG
jgi:hypothetical protein